MKKALTLMALGAGVAVATENLSKNPTRFKKMAKRTLKMMKM